MGKKRRNLDDRKIDKDLDYITAEERLEARMAGLAFAMAMGVISEHVDRTNPYKYRNN